MRDQPDTVAQGGLRDLITTPGRVRFLNLMLPICSGILKDLFKEGLEENLIY